MNFATRTMKLTERGNNKQTTTYSVDNIEFIKLTGPNNAKPNTDKA